jgi:hypothetical protein
MPSIWHPMRGPAVDADDLGFALVSRHPLRMRVDTPSVPPP